MLARILEEAGMEIIEGGRDQLERELAVEIFRPADNRERIAEVIGQLAPRGKLRLLTPIDSVPSNNRL